LFSSSSASASAKQTLFYVEVTDDMQIHPGRFNCKIFFYQNNFKEYYLCNIIEKLYFIYKKFSIQLSLLKVVVMNQKVKL